MASPKRSVPPSYDATMERLGRSPTDSETILDKSSHSHGIVGVYRRRSDEEDTRHIDVEVVERENSRAGEDEAGSGQPATISHTIVQPRYVEPATTLLPHTPTVASPSPEPPGHFTKPVRYKKSTSRSPTKQQQQPQRSPDAYAYQNQQSIDYWAAATGPESVIDSNDPVVMQPMVTRVGSDGRTYLRDTSIVVVQHKEHETPNTKIVYGKPVYPNEYLWYAILGLFCCIACGIPSYRHARRVRQRFEALDYSGAHQASSSARNWGTAALLTGAFIIILFLFLLFVSPCPLARAIDAQDICPLGT